MAWVDHPGVVAGAIVAAVVAFHVWASATTRGTIAPEILARVSVSPATTLSRARNHLLAAWFHHSWLHLAFNVAVFAASFGPAARGHSAWATAATALATSLVGVLLLHLLLVRPLANAGMAYAAAAMHQPLVGFSVAAYCTMGMAVAGLPAPLLVAACALVVAFELAMGVVLRVTTPFVWVYHLVGFAVGLAVRTAWP